MSIGDTWHLFLDNTVRCVHSKCPTIYYVNEEKALCNTSLTITTLSKIGHYIVEHIRSTNDGNEEKSSSYTGALYKDLKKNPEIYRLGKLKVFLTHNAMVLLAETKITTKSCTQWTKKSKITNRENYVNWLTEIISSMKCKNPEFNLVVKLGTCCKLANDIETPEEEESREENDDEEGEEKDDGVDFKYDETVRTYVPDEKFEGCRLRPILFARNTFFCNNDDARTPLFESSEDLTTTIAAKDLDRILDQCFRLFVPYFGSVAQDASRIYAANVGGSCIGEQEIENDDIEEKRNGEKRVTYNRPTAFANKNIVHVIVVNADLKRTIPGCSIVNTGKGDSYAITFKEAMSILEEVFTGIRYTKSGVNKVAIPFSGAELMQHLCSDFVNDMANITTKLAYKTTEEFRKFVTKMVFFDKVTINFNDNAATTFHCCEKKREERSKIKLSNVSVDVIATLLMAFVHKIGATSAKSYVNKTIVRFVDGVCTKTRLNEKSHKKYKISSIVVAMLSILMDAVKHETVPKGKNRLTAPSEQARTNVNNALEERDDD